jgi:hypothetical protein
MNNLDAEVNEVRPMTPEEWKAEEKRRRDADNAKALESLDRPARGAPGDPDGPKATSFGSGRGKIARLPEPLRKEVCHRLLREQSGTEILSWLNSLPEVRAALQPYFADVVISAQNLCHWRDRGFDEWLRRLDREERARELAEYAIRIGAKAGVDLGAATTALLYSQLLLLIEPMESLITEMARGGHQEERIAMIAKDMAQIAQALNLVRAGEHQARMVELKAQAVAISRERLELAKAAQQLAREKWAFKMTNVQGACARPPGDTKMSNDQLPNVQGNPNDLMSKAAAGNTPDVQGACAQPPGEAAFKMSNDEGRMTKAIPNDPISKPVTPAGDNTPLLNEAGAYLFPKHWTGVEKPDSAYTPEELAARRKQQAEDSAVAWAQTMADQEYYNECFRVAQQLITGAGALPSKLSPEVFGHLETPAALGRTEEEMRAVVAEVQQRAEAAVRFPIEQKIRLAAERAEYEQRTGLDALTGKPLVQGVDTSPPAPLPERGGEGGVGPGGQ